MNSSISNSNPLLADLNAQRGKLWLCLRKLFLFVLLLFICDRALDAVLRKGLDQYFGLNRPAQILCVGHSRTILGIDTAALEQSAGVPVVKYALDGANIGDRLAMIKHYFSRQPDSVRVVIYDVDPFTFTGEGLSSNSYKMFYPYIDNSEVGEYVARYAPTRFEYALRFVFRSMRYDEVTLGLALRGLGNKRSNLKRGTVDLQRVRNQIERGENLKVRPNPQNMKDFEETMKLIRAHGARVVLVYIPEVDVLTDADRDGQKKITEIFWQYAANDPGITFLDYNADYEHRHELFYDAIHLNPEGQKVVTERLGADVKPLLRLK
jgi:hypothetical protein